MLANMVVSAFATIFSHVCAWSSGSRLNAHGVLAPLGCSGHIMSATADVASAKLCLSLAHGASIGHGVANLDTFSTLVD